jgi:uncharacterized protein YjbJ (UPF0337 family)
MANRHAERFRSNQAADRTTSSIGVNPMNQQTVEGKFDQVTGKIKQSVGEAVGNQKLANSGTVDQVKGAAKESWGHAKDAANAVVDDHRREANAEGDNIRTHSEANAHDIREKITTSAKNAKDSIVEKFDEIKHKHE